MLSQTTDDSVERGREDCKLVLNGWDEQNTKDHPNLSIARPIPCFEFGLEIGCRKGLAHETIRRVFVDLGGRKDVASVGGKHYPMIVKDDFTRRAWMYFLRSKSDAGSAFRSFLAMCAC